MGLALMMNVALVAVTVLIHFEALNQLSIYIPKLTIKRRLKVLVGVFGAMIAHVLEICFFGIGYYYMINHTGFGILQGSVNNSLIDCLYFSFVSYTTLGYGNIIATGDIRFLTGLEALTGLVLITWMASFMFIEMEKQ